MRLAAKGKNPLISPVSVMHAPAATADGADRPFVYAIIDDAANPPLFTGTAKSMN